MSLIPKVEVRTMGSPTYEFALIIAVLYQSLKKASGLDFQLTVFIGAPSAQSSAAAAFAEWLQPEIQGVVVDPIQFEQHWVHANSAERISAPSDADLVLYLDADMVVCGDVSEFVVDIIETPAVAGVIAHVQPISHEEWEHAYAITDAGIPSFPYRYSGWPYMWAKGLRNPGSMQAPPYYNFGFVAIPATILNSIRAHFRECSYAVAKQFPDNMFRDQIALTLAIAKSSVPHRAIGMRYNFPNDFRLEALHPGELMNARLIHLLRRNDLFDKQIVFQNLESLRAFVNSEWETAGAIERARKVIAEIFPEIEAMSLPSELAQAQWRW